MVGIQPKSVTGILPANEKRQPIQLPFETRNPSLTPREAFPETRA